MRVCLAALFSLLLAPLAGASAQTVESFYAGRTLDLIVGFPPGGNYDLFARPIARNLGKYIPGAPNVVIKYMPGAGSIVAANHVYGVAPKDGTVLAIVSPTGPLDARLNPASVKFKATEFAWIGRIAPQPFAAIVWHTAPVRTLDEARKTEIALGTSGVGSGTLTYPQVTNVVLGTRFKLVSGYKGSAEALMAMERGEVHGHVTGIEIVKTAHPDWLRDKKVNLLVQFTLTRHPVMPDVPAIVEFARNADEAAVLRTVMFPSEIGRSMLATPGIAPERVTALRRAFDAMTKDAEFVAELRKGAMDVLPLSGEDLAKLVEELDAMPAATVEKVRAAYGG